MRRWRVEVHERPIARVEIATKIEPLPHPPFRAPGSVLSRRALRCSRKQLPHDAGTGGDGRAQHRRNDGSAHRPTGCDVPIEPAPNMGVRKGRRIHRDESGAEKNAYSRLARGIAPKDPRGYGAHASLACGDVVVAGGGAFRTSYYVFAQRGATAAHARAGVRNAGSINQRLKFDKYAQRQHIFICYYRYDIIPSAKLF